MAFLGQIWTLMSKNFRSLLRRHIAICVWMAFVLPILLSGFFSYAKNLFVPPATYGIGHASPVMTLADAFGAAHASGRDKVVLVNDGHGGGDIERVLDQLGDRIAAQDTPVKVVRVGDENDIVGECPSSLRGVTTCFCAVVMRSSPHEGAGGIWNYTIRTDSAMAASPFRVDIDKDTNAGQVYLLPVQRAVDSIIAGLGGNASAADALADNHQLPFTDRSQHERAVDVREIYQNAIINFLGVVFIATVLWITYHLTGFIATERESGMAQLLDAMMPVRQQWMSQAARIIANHLSFSAIYAPAWIIASLVVRAGVFTNTSIGIVLIFHILAGLSLASMSILFASFFKKAQLSGVTAILATLLLGVLAQSITGPHTGTVAGLSVLFAPCSYVYFITFMAHFEKQNRATNLVGMPPDSHWHIPGIVFWIFLIVQIFVYPLLGALIEKRFYGTSTRGRRVVSGDSADELGNDALQLRGFTKVYPPGIFSRMFSFRSKPQPVVAVSDLTLNAGRGQIVALLGANGSGKSTTLDAIAGLNRLDGGNITIDGTGGMGIAPQKNVLWDDMTVEEHLMVFNRLKAPKGQRATKEEITELIKSIDLLPKRKSQAKTLSGGQKRKLQLGMMLTGGSAVCCVDEVSSGLDPLSRRKIWDILLAERGKRTLILTTHFLDEADLLADHIAILSKGTLRAEGSSVELKDRLGSGYRVRVQRHPELKHTPDVAGVRKKSSLDLITYIAPSSSLAAQVIRELEGAGITQYRFSGPTIEDVFLQLAEEIKDEEAFRSTDMGAALREKTEEADDYSQDSSNPQGLKLLDGHRVGYVRQAVILFSKRLTVLKRNWLPYIIAFFLPIVAAALTSLFIKGQSPPGCSPADQASTSATEDAFTQVAKDDSVVFLAGPSSGFAVSTVASLIAPIFSGPGSDSLSGLSALGNVKLVDTYDDWTQYIADHRKNVTSGLWLGDSKTPPTLGWVANLFVTSPMTAQQFLDVLLTNTTISTTWSPFEVPFNPKTGDSLNLVIYMGLALSCAPAFFALYPSNERRRFVRGLQYSNGVRPLPLWMAYLLFDFGIIFVSAAIVTAIWAGVSNIWYHVEYLFVVFFLYGLASILTAYIVSLFTKTQLATYAWSAAMQAVFFLAYLIAYMCVNTYVTAAKIQHSLVIVNFAVSAIAPIGSATRALFLALNLFSSACDNTHIASNPGGILQYGGPIVYLVVQSLILFGLLLWLDSGSAGSSIRGLFSRERPGSDDAAEDEEVAHELERVTSQGTHENGLRVMHLTKSFGKNTAVDNVSFGIRRGEVFALLGPNGAGKSTTISLIRGDIKPSRNGGDIFVEEASVTKNLTDARANLGVCPQIDALDQMTVREHLEFYARVRGIPDVEHNVAAVLRAVGLEAFAARMAHALSGGNKRKLSLGIALMGNPTVVLLDEPSSGLDAASKRIMWKTLADTVPGRSILLTTHSMEEADALAGRAGILARRMLALGTPDDLRHRFGDALHVHLVSATSPRTTPEEMERVLDWVRRTFPSATVEEKTYHGQTRFSVGAADVLAATRDIGGGSGGGPKTSEEVGVEEIAREGDDEKDIVDLADISNSAVGHLAVLLEERKAELGIGHYSVTPTTLDQVFLTIVGRHNVREENYEEKPKKRAWWGGMVTPKK